MKRILLAAGLGIALFSVVAFAASLSFSGGGVAAEGAGDVGSCGPVAVTWGQNDQGQVSQVTLDFPDACAGKKVFVKAERSDNYVFGEGQCTLGGAENCIVSFASPFAAGPLHHARIAITDY